MFQRIRKSKITKIFSVFMIFNFLVEVIHPLAAFALTGGPSQPEVQSFQPIGLTDMVDPFTGDYSYNIPLLDVGGYPINMVYNAGITMDQEASWVGLGWNINPGVITRNMRGLPDDFNGDKVEQEFNMKPNKTYGISAGFGAELFGLDALSLNYSLGVNFNNYNGIGFEQSLSPSFSAGKGGAEDGTASLGLNITANNNGLSLSPSLSFSEKTKATKENDSKMVGVSIGVKINSRAGLQSLTIGMSGGPESPGKDPKNTRLSALADKGMKKEFGLTGSSGGSTISMINSTYVPQMDFPRLNTSVSFSTKFGGTLFGLEGTFNIGGYYSENSLLKSIDSRPAYGYLNEQNGYALKKVMLDFNREKDGAFTRSTPNLPLTNHSYDIFSIAGQGIGGMFRPFRADVGYLHDSYNSSISASGSLGLELASGNLVHVGADINVNAVTSHVGNWTKHNEAQKYLNFKTITADSPFEPVYLKQAGEKTVDDDPDFITNDDNQDCIGGYDPVRIKLTAGPGFNATAENAFISKYLSATNTVTPATYTISTDGDDLKRYKDPATGSNQRVKRNMPISYLTKNEAMAFGVEGYVSPNAKPDHIAEVDVVRTDGSRYIYGIAAYNTIQKEVAFNVTGNTNPSCSTGLIDFSAADASSENSKGADNYFNKTTTPAFAHSYLLTSVLSPDYSDVDGIRGPSVGDLGSYTKFNYDKDNNPVNGIQPQLSAYKWRTPYVSTKAAYNEGLKTVVNDDKGSYVYGEKELWYLENIETKTHIAVFYTSARSDAKEAGGETSGTGTNNMFKLDSIRLFSRPDYMQNGTSAVPIKVVHFEYDYSLCPGSENSSASGNGKLTLKKLFFTYQKSYRGKISPYEFTYADWDHDNGVVTAAENPSYNLKGYDRWGYYKPNNIPNCDLTASTATVIPAADFPYVEQNNAGNIIDRQASSWSLTSIKLPSGGEIQIDYESDDYAYVQDKPAMQMIKILSAGTTVATDPNPVSGNNKLYASTSTEASPDQYLFFKLPGGVASGSAEVKDKYFRDIKDNGKNLYFRFLVAMQGTPTASNVEYVSGYTPIVDAGWMGATYSDWGFVKLKADDIGEDGRGQGGDGDPNNANPISKAAWNYCRLYNQRLAYGNSTDPTKTSIEGIIVELAQASLINQMIDFSKGVNTSMRKKGFGQYFVSDKSWIRLYNPNNKKYGGGVRVKKLRISDSWDKMNVDYSDNGNQDTEFQYGQEYAYSLSDGTSSGVASYEPLAGGDENPFRQPVFFSEEHILAPDDRNYQEEPYGESFFPAPGVGYSRVEVKNLQHGGVIRHATGKTVHEFYTAKDFPVWTDRTGVDAIEQRTKGLANLFAISHKDCMTASQGFVIELNDMHGKPKAQWVYAEGQSTPISGVEYKYNTKEESKTLNISGFSGSHLKVTRNRLDNEVVVLHKNKRPGDSDDEIAEKSEVGVDVDFATDFRESQTNNHSFAMKGNLAAFLAAILPVAVPTIFPSYSSEKTRFRSAVTTKVVNRYGILRETIAHDLGSQVSTQNLAWDAETGEVLLTKTKNNFNDEIYNFTYPAHWGYDRMAAAYRNIGYVEEADVAFSTTASFTVRSLFTPNHPYLAKGDEVIVIQKSTGRVLGKAWVWDDDENISDMQLIDKKGFPFNGSPALNATTTCYLKVIRSGRRNMQNTPIGTITSFKNPIASTDPDSDGRFAFAFTEGSSNIDVLNASMQEYSEKWQTYCPVIYQNDCVCTTNNHFMNQWNDAFDYLLLNNLFDNNSVPINLDVSQICPGVNQVYWNGPNLATATSNTITACLGPTPSYSCTPLIDCCVDFSLLPGEPCSTGFNWSDIVSLNIVGTLPKAGSMGCEDQAEDALAVAVFNNAGSGSCTASIRIHIDCMSFGSCSDGCSPDIHMTNPYVVGLRGNWRPQRTFAFQTGRDQALVSSITDPNYKNTSIRSDGKFATYENFWSAPSSGDWTIDSTGWTFASEVKEYSPFGFEIENRDALGRYSAAIYGYSNTLPKAVASNAGQPDIAFDGFEDYTITAPNECCDESNLRFGFFTETPVLSQAHTGRYSMQVATSATIAATYPLQTAPCTEAADDKPYTFKDCDIIKDFAPRSYIPRDFILSYWVKQPNSTNARVFDYPDTRMDVFLNASSTAATPVETNKSDIIDGWQRVEKRYTILSSHTSIKIAFINTNTSSLTAFIDDIRIQPFNSSMKTFVYDPVSLRLWAELDERNFATIYEYDEDGALMRVKKETERGIMTIQESRNHTKQ